MKIWRGRHIGIKMQLSVVEIRTGHKRLDGWLKERGDGSKGINTWGHVLYEAVGWR